MRRAPGGAASVCYRNVRARSPVDVFDAGGVGAPGVPKLPAVPNGAERRRRAPWLRDRRSRRARRSGVARAPQETWSRTTPGRAGAETDRELPVRVEQDQLGAVGDRRPARRRSWSDRSTARGAGARRRRSSRPATATSVDAVARCSSDRSSGSEARFAISIHSRPRSSPVGFTRISSIDDLARPRRARVANHPSIDVATVASLSRRRPHRRAPATSGVSGSARSTGVRRRWRHCLRRAAGIRRRRASRPQRRLVVRRRARPADVAPAGVARPRRSVVGRSVAPSPGPGRSRSPRRAPGPRPIAPTTSATRHVDSCAASSAQASDRLRRRVSALAAQVPLERLVRLGQALREIGRRALLLRRARVADRGGTCASAAGTNACTVSKSDPAGTSSAA